MAASIEEILAAATLREESVDVCVAGALNARWEDLGRQLAQLLERTAGDPLPEAKLGDAGGDVQRRVALTEEMEALRQQMAAASYTFLLRALPRRAFRDLLDAHPPRPEIAREAAFNAATFPPALIRKCLIEPAVATDAQFDELLDKITEGQVGELFDAAWLANQGGSEVPKSVPASGRIPSTGRS